MKSAADIVELLDAGHYPTRYFPLDYSIWSECIDTAEYPENQRLSSNDSIRRERENSARVAIMSGDEKSTIDADSIPILLSEKFVDPGCEQFFR